MNLVSLQDFIAVAETGSLSQAAGHRNISISALSRRLSALEDWLGVTLVDRHKRPTELTFAGHLFKDVALNIIYSLEQIRETLQREIPGQNILTFALPLALRDTYFSEFLRKVRVDDVNFEAEVLVGTEAARLREILEKAASDYLIYFSKPDFPFRLPSGYRSLFLDADRLVPVSVPHPDGQPRYPVPGRPESYSPHLSQGPGSYFMELVNDLVHRSGRAHFLRQFVHTEGSEPLLQSVRNGKGLAWLPGSLVNDDLKSGRLVRAGSAEWIIPLEIRIARGVMPLRAPGEALWEVLERRSRV